jgi:hypothetical protein
MDRRLMKKAKKSRYQLLTQKNLLNNKKSRIRKRALTHPSRTSSLRWFHILMLNTLSIF